MIVKHHAGVYRECLLVTIYRPSCPGKGAAYFDNKPEFTHQTVAIVHQVDRHRGEQIDLDNVKVACDHFSD